MEVIARTAREMVGLQHAQKDLPGPSPGQANQPLLSCTTLPELRLCCEGKLMLLEASQVCLCLDGWVLLAS